MPRIFGHLTSNRILINSGDTITASKLRITYARYLTGSSGNKTAFIMVDKFMKNPINSNSLPIHEYSKVLPLFSGVGIDLVYTNEDSGSYDVILKHPETFSQIEIKVLIDGNESNLDITNLNPFQVEIYFEE